VNHQSVLLLSGSSFLAVQGSVLEEIVLSLGLQLRCTAPQHGLEHLKEQIQAGQEPCVILIAPDTAHVAVLGRELRKLWASGHLIFITTGESTSALQKQLQHAPMIGSHWSIADADDADLGKTIGDAVHNTLRRAKLRTTLNKANAQLQAQAPLDSLEFRRLLLSERYLESFLSQTNDAIVSLDANATVLYCNASASRLFGISANAMLGLPASRLACWSSSLQQDLDRVAGEQSVLTSESDCVFAGKAVPIEVVFSTVRDDAGTFIGTTLIIRDISVRREHAEAQRQAQESRHRALERERVRLVAMFDQAPGFMAIMKGPEHVFELANQAYCQMAGSRELLGITAKEAFPEVVEQGFLTLLDRVYQTGRPYLGKAMPIVFQRQAGRVEELFVDFVYQPVLDEQGRVTGIFCQGSDVTAQKLAQNALLTHQATLENLVNEKTAALLTTEAALHQSQKLEAIGKLTGGVAHDFNNILQIIASNLEMIEAESRDNPATLARLRKAIASVDRGAKLSSQLLSFARRQPLKPLATNLGRILREVDDLLRRALGETIEIETIVDAELWMAMVDRNQLENVILNLAINARDAMQSEGQLTLELGNAMLDDAYVRSETDLPAGHYVMLAVSDTGSGMSAETMEHAFDPFFTTKGEGEGTGLGLSMVYGFVKQSGGHIRIYSELGHGTTFKIYLPRVHLPEALIDDIRSAPALGGSETVLVVEDDLALQATVVEMLTGLGYQTLQAKDGATALEVLKSGVPIDLLFTDVVMPGPVRSPDLARQAKEIHPDIEVLFTSGYTHNAIVHGGRLDPGVELISKPYRRDDLARKIGHCLAHKRQAGSAPNASSMRRILVVEDDTDGCEMLCELLCVLGHDPHGVSNAEDALLALDEHDFDILLTDIGLPGMSGTALAKIAKQNKPELSVIFASGYGVAAGLEFTSFALPKPYDLAMLQQVLDDAG
jgi:PAS domain S-box-containing protein